MAAVVSFVGFVYQFGWLKKGSFSFVADESVAGFRGILSACNGCPVIKGVGPVMKRKFALRASVFVLAILVLVAKPALAQNANGTVIGTVYDQQGSVVPGASVTVVNTSTQIAHTVGTRGDGTFEVPNLPIGPYRVEVEQAGFAKVVTQAKPLQINQSLKFDITLVVGTANESVTVSANVSTVETASPRVGAKVGGDANQQAPLNVRNTLDLALLQPGVTETNPDNTGKGTYSIAGGRTDSVTYLMDGSMNNDLLDNGVTYNPNPDTIAEFRILENNYSAEYGRNSGGIISEVTKSGPNEWHGSAYDYLRNGDLDANSYFNHLNDVERDPLRRNQYGGAFGRPIWIPKVINGKDRFFFFVAYQGQKESDLTTPVLTQTQVLSTAETACITTPAAGCDFSSDPNVVAFTEANPFFPAPGQPNGFLNPAALNPVSLNYINDGLMPVTASGVITPTSALINNNNELTMRFVFQATAKDQITATLGGERNPNTEPFLTASNQVPWEDVPGFPSSTQINDDFLNLGDTHIFSPNLLNEVRFSTQRLFEDQGNPLGPNAADTAAKLDFTNLTPDNSTGPPLIDINAEETNVGYTFSGPTTLANNTFGVSDTLTWVRGKQSWKMGFGVSAYQNNQVFDFITNGLFDFNGSISGNGFADFLLCAPTDYTQGAAAPSDIRTKSWFGFFQDEWRLTKTFTLNLGIRYEYNSPKLDTLGRTFSIIPGDISTRFPGAPVGVVFPGDQGAPRGANFPDRTNWAPRIGFAWNPDGHGKTSIRGGFGIFYDILKAEDNFQFNGQPPFFSLANFTFPTTLTGNDCAASNESASPITYFSDPFDSSCNINTFPSVARLSGPAYFAIPGSLPFGPH